VTFLFAWMGVLPQSYKSDLHSRQYPPLTECSQGKDGPAQINRQTRKSEDKLDALLHSDASFQMVKQVIIKSCILSTVFNLEDITSKLASSPFLWLWTYKLFHPETFGLSFYFLLLLCLFHNVFLPFPRTRWVRNVDQ